MRVAVENYVARFVGQRLERGAGPLWPQVALPVARRVILPEARVIGVGGALIGGSGRTPLALAIVEWLAARGAPIAFVGHGYGARQLHAPLRVDARHTARDVGDEAVLAFRRLAARRIPVWVGPREATLDIAARSSSILVVDGLLQTTPVPLTLAVLALSAPSPWGSGETLPRGNLLARPARLVSEADHVIVLADTSIDAVPHAPRAEIARTTLRVPTRTGRFGLLLGIARPERVAQALARRGFQGPTLLAADHHAAAAESGARQLIRAHALDGVYVTEKCDAALGASSLPRAVLELEVTLPERLQAALAAITHSSADVVPCLAEKESPRVSP